MSDTAAPGPRLAALDVLRGIGIMGVVFLHGSLYHYADLLKIDFSDPPPVVTIIGLLLMWAGLFAVVSGVAHAMQTARRLAAGDAPRDVLRWSLINGALILAVGYVYFLFLGPALLDRVKGDHDYSMLMGLLVKGQLAWPSIERVLYVDALIMVACNVALGGVVLWALLRDGGLEKVRRNTVVLALLGTAFVALSFFRIQLYPMMQDAIARRDWAFILPLDYLVNKNNPIFPFLGFGLMGAMVGLRLAAYPDDWKRVWKPVLPLAIVWLVAGVAGYLALPDTMLERPIDEMWFFIMVAQVGLFLLLTLGALRFFDKAPVGAVRARTRAAAFIRRFGVAGLSVFLVETPVSELASKAVSVVAPGWDHSMSNTLVFAAVLVVAWGLVLKAWERSGYAFSVERLLVRAMALAGKRSTKLPA